MAGNTKNAGGFQNLIKQVQWGADTGGPMGAMAAFMGVPWMHRGGGGGQPWQTFNPMSRQITPGGFKDMNNYGSRKPGGDQNDPSKPPEDPLLKAGFTPWYVDWLRSSGQTGTWARPPGLLG